MTVFEHKKTVFEYRLRETMPSTPLPSEAHAGDNEPSTSANPAEAPLTEPASEPLLHEGPSVSISLLASAGVGRGSEPDLDLENQRGDANVRPEHPQDQQVTRAVASNSSFGAPAATGLSATNRRNQPLRAEMLTERATSSGGRATLNVEGSLVRAASQSGRGARNPLLESDAKATCLFGSAWRSQIHGTHRLLLCGHFVGCRTCGAHATRIQAFHNLRRPCAPPGDVKASIKKRRADRLTRGCDPETGQRVCASTLSLPPGTKIDQPGPAVVA